MDNFYYDRLDAAWNNYIKALDDHKVPYSDVVKLRSVYESILHEKLDVTPCQ